MLYNSKVWFVLLWIRFSGKARHNWGDLICNPVGCSLFMSSNYKLFTRVFRRWNKHIWTGIQFTFSCLIFGKQYSNIIIMSQGALRRIFHFLSKIMMSSSNLCLLRVKIISRVYKGCYWWRGTGRLKKMLSIPKCIAWLHVNNFDPKWLNNTCWNLFCFLLLL